MVKVKVNKFFTNHLSKMSWQHIKTINVHSSVSLQWLNLRPESSNEL